MESLYSCHIAFLIFFYLVIPESPQFISVRGKNKKVAKVLDNIAWINEKDLPDGVLRTTTDHKMSKSDAAGDDSIIELLVQTTRSRIGSFIILVSMD